MWCILPALLFLSVLISSSLAEESVVVNDTSKLMKQGEYEKAIDQLQNSHSLFPYNKTIKQDLAEAYYACAKRQLERKQFDEAAENFGNALKLFPDNQEFAINQGMALYSGKRYDESAIILQQARQVIGDQVVILFYLGRIHYDTGDLSAALELWDKALAIDPGNKPIRQMAEKARREALVESPMGKEYKSIFVISYDEGSSSDLADDVMNVLESAYNQVGSDLYFYPTAHVPVLLYTKKEYRLVTKGPEWSGGLYDGKIRLPIGGAKKISSILRAVLTHEYTHVVVGELTRKNCPVWLNEGLAEFEGRKEFDTPLLNLEAAAKSGTLLPFDTLEKSLLSMSTKEASLAYQQSYSMVKFMISSYGLHKVREVLVNLGTGMRVDEAIAKAFKDYGLDYNGIVKEWQVYIQKEYGK